MNGKLFFIILFLGIQYNLLSGQNLENQKFYNHLIELGLETQLDYQDIESFIDQGELEKVGRFNHYAELLNIGFHPDEDYYDGNYYKDFWLSFIIYQMDCIAGERVHLQLPEFDIDRKSISKNELYRDNPESFLLIINQDTIQVNVDADHDRAGLGTLFELCNAINNNLGAQGSDFRFLLLETSSKMFGFSGSYILNHKITILPKSVIKSLIEERYINLSDQFKSTINSTNTISNNYKWGQTLPSLTDLIQKDQIYFLGQLINQSKIEQVKIFIQSLPILYDEIQIKVNKKKNSESFNLMTVFDEDLLVIDKSDSIEVTIIHEGKSFSSSVWNGEYNGLLYNDEFIRFLNHYLYETNQKIYLGRFHLNNDHNIENVISYLKMRPDELNLYSDSYLKVPHLMLKEKFNELALGGVGLTCIIVLKYSQFNVFDLGYVHTNYEELIKIRKKENQ